MTLRVPKTYSISCWIIMESCCVHITLIMSTGSFTQEVRYLAFDTWGLTLFIWLHSCIFCSRDTEGRRCVWRLPKFLVLRYFHKLQSNITDFCCWYVDNLLRKSNEHSSENFEKFRGDKVYWIKVWTYILLFDKISNIKRVKNVNLHLFLS